MSPELKIRTPEGIEFSLQLAGPVSRCLAYSIDLFTVAAAATIIKQLLMIVSVLNRDFSMALFVLAQFSLQIGYCIGCEWLWRGQTIGKRLLNLRVIDESGLRLEFSQIVVRNLIRFVDALPFFYAVGGTFCFLNSRCQRLGDLAANTVVIRSRPFIEPDLDQLALGKFNSLRECGHLAARLRQRVSPLEAGIALDALLRRDAFDSEARVALFSELANHYRQVVTFPPEIAETLTDEQYLRNVVEILFRSQS